jgi:hypothetical protein
MHGHAVLFRSRLQNAQALGDHFLTDAIAGNDRDPIRFLAHSWDSLNLLPWREHGLLMALQWTKLRAGATLQCNVDRDGADRLPISPSVFPPTPLS